jgi:nucleoside-diphosphate-sugar epimerase
MMKWHMQERNVQSRVARYHNVYGPYGSWNDGREKAPAALCRKIAIAKLTRSTAIDVWGDGEQVRSFMYVDDCVEGTIRILRSDVEEPLNLGSDGWVTINQLVEVISDVAGYDVHVVHEMDKPQGVRGRNSDNTKIKEALDWQPTTPLYTGIEETYKWIYQCVKETMHE